MNLSFPDHLPVSREREAIAEALAAHPVVIVCGDTGSGKTTQLPKIALQAGYGDPRGGRIGCTQPRRIAATSVARRVAEELGVVLGEEVGYQIRFEDRTRAGSTQVKFMTDGILLAETRRDPELRQYGFLIVDEAHERSLNIDFILGYLRRILERRRDLRVAISSATLDARVFSDFFGGAPVVEVEGRAFPVEDRFQPPLHEGEPLVEQVARAVEDLAAEDPLGDTLVFLPGEREIREAADLLEGRRLPRALVLPLYARQAGKEQEPVFRPARDRRRIILATNVAETSLTIPDIRFVVDSGLARISRYDTASGIQRLRLEPVSQASARQRRGRCGRVSEGICIKLYEEADLAERSEYTDPEIRRTNLAGVVLQMEHLGLGDPLKFPFVDPPQPKRVALAYRVLQEIGAMAKRGRALELTETGRTLARLPVDPRIGRLLVAARDEGCLAEGLVVASALAVQDPRERPREKQEAADQAHRRFRDKRSDFTSWLRWWEAVREARAGSNNRLRRFCQENFLNYRRVQEWTNLHRELRDVLRELGWKTPPAGKPLGDLAETYSEPLHRAVLAAIPSRIGLNQGKKLGYKGAGGSLFHLFPGSGLFASAPAWAMAFELVETSRLWAREAAAFDPSWVEKVAPHLCRYRYSNPHWVAEQGAVYGEETVLAFGLPVVERRRIHYARVDRALARRIFIQEALVKGETRAPLPALAKNRETLAAAERLEHKLRRLGGLVHPEAVFAFYDERVPPEICTQSDFEKWVYGPGQGAIDFALEDCLLPQTTPFDPEDYPDRLAIWGGEGEDEEARPLSLALSYRHAPGEDDDGVTLEIPLIELASLGDWTGDWLVSAWLPEKVGALLRCLRKETRTLLPAHREVVEGFLTAWEGYDPACGLVEAICEHLESAFGVAVSASSFDLSRLPFHLRMRYRVHDDDGATLAAGRDLEELKAACSGHLERRFAEVARRRFRERRVDSWSFGTLPERLSLDHRTHGYPRLGDDGGERPFLRVWADETCARRQHRLGLGRLFLVTRGELVRRLAAVLWNARKGSAMASPAGAQAGRAPAAGSPRGGDSGFASLAAAFAGAGHSPGSGGAMAPSRPPVGRQEDQGKQTAPSQNPEAGFFNPQETFLLDSLGPAPGRNRGDFLVSLVDGVFGLPLDAGTWEAAALDLEKRYFEAAAKRASPVGKILAVASRVAALLEDEALLAMALAESVEDARAHFTALLAPGWLLLDDLGERLVHWEGLQTRLERLKGSTPLKDYQKLERFRERMQSANRADASEPCACCPAALASEARDRDEFVLRLEIFAPELRARVKRP